MLNFNSLPELIKYFSNEEIAVKYYEDLRWNDNPVCPHCSAENPYKTNRGYKCSNNECYKKFSVRVGTIFENSKIPFSTWFAAIYLCTSHKKGISSVQLGIDLNITQKSAWYMLHRIREMMKASAPASLGVNGPVEVDEAHIGGKEKNRHKSKRQSEINPELSNDGKKYNKKKVVIGLVERNGSVVAKLIPAPSTEAVTPVIEKYLKSGSEIMTDESNIYYNLSKKYTHSTVNHKMSVYVAGNTHTNTIENFWSVLKRGLNGIYHCVSEKHLERYLNEFSSRYNTRDTNSYERFENFLKKSEGGLLYKVLTAKQ